MTSGVLHTSKFKFVHPGHFATILRSIGCTGNCWPPWEVDWPPNFCQIMTPFDDFFNFWPTYSENKYPTTPIIYVLLSYDIHKYVTKKAIKFPKKMVNPFWVICITPYMWTISFNLWRSSSVYFISPVIKLLYSISSMYLYRIIWNKRNNRIQFFFLLNSWKEDKYSYIKTHWILFI